MSAPPAAPTSPTGLLSPAAARRVFLVLTLTRWFPVGLVVGIITLWQLERGLSIGEAALATSCSGIVVFLLELPTSGFSDAFGRRPVYVVASLVGVASAVAYLTAASLGGFIVAAVLFGVFRALDSGPLEAWYVDTVHATDPGADVDGGLAAQGTMLGLAIAAGALVSGGLIWWHPVVAFSALWLPVAIHLVLNLVHLGVVLLLLREPGPGEVGEIAGDDGHTPLSGHPDSLGAVDNPAATGGAARAVASARRAPAVVREGLGLLRSNRVLRGLVLAEVSWAVAMVVFEMFQPIRLAELVGGEERAGAWMGPIAAGGWAVFAAGSALAGLTSKRLGVARTALLGRLLNSLGAVVMGLVAGPVALVAAYAMTYSMHGFAGPMHAALLHREARARTRATVLSMNSMVAFAAFSVAAPLVGLLADRASTQTAMVVAGVVSLTGLLCYLPARRAEREGGRGPSATPS